MTTSTSFWSSLIALLWSVKELYCHWHGVVCSRVLSWRCTIDKKSLPQIHSLILLGGWGEHQIFKFKTYYISASIIDQKPSYIHTPWGTSQTTSTNDEKKLIAFNKKAKPPDSTFPEFKSEADFIKWKTLFLSKLVLTYDEDIFDPSYVAPSLANGDSNAAVKLYNRQNVHLYTALLSESVTTLAGSRLIMVSLCGRDLCHTMGLMWLPRKVFELAVSGLLQ